ncbi:MAG TPA: PaaI family thioesterase [Dehalococcoidia bacterium]
MTMEVLTPTRTLTVAWEDPAIGVTAGRGMRGIDYLRAMANGELPPPPIGQLLGIQILEVDEGRVVFGAVPGEQHYNPLGTVHGGLAATLFDSAMGCAVLSTLPAGSTFTTLEIKVNFVQPMTRDTGLVRCEARVVHAGSRISTAEAKLADAAGKLYGHATTTCMILRS